MKVMFLAVITDNASARHKSTLMIGDVELHIEYTCPETSIKTSCMACNSSKRLPE